MKTLTNLEVEALNRVVEDVNITIESTFSTLPQIAINNLKALVPIFVGLYFKSLNHDPGNKFWKNKDHIYPINNYSNIVRNIIEVHAGYTSFDNLKNYLKENDFSKVDNTFGEAVGDYVVSRETEKSNKHYFVVLSGLDVLNNFYSLEYIFKNKMGRIIPIIYTKTSNEAINKENKLNGRLINLGFDTLVINGEKPEYVCDAIAYARNLRKPSIILANVN